MGASTGGAELATALLSPAPLTSLALPRELPRLAGRHLPEPSAAGAVRFLPLPGPGSPAPALASRGGSSSCGPRLSAFVLHASGAFRVSVTLRVIGIFRVLGAFRAAYFLPGLVLVTEAEAPRARFGRSSWGVLVGTEGADGASDARKVDGEGPALSESPDACPSLWLDVVQAGAHGRAADRSSSFSASCGTSKLQQLRGLSSRKSDGKELTSFSEGTLSARAAEEGEAGGEPAWEGVGGGKATAGGGEIGLTVSPRGGRVGSPLDGREGKSGTNQPDVSRREGVGEGAKGV